MCRAIKRNLVSNQLENQSDHALAIKRYFLKKLIADINLLMKRDLHQELALARIELNSYEAEIERRKAK